MRTKILNELKSNFEPYAVLWDEWVHSSSCTLSKEEIVFMAAQIKNNFTVHINEFISFYNNMGIIQTVMQKLKSSYNEFQDWVLLRFPNQLLGLVDQGKIDSFLETPISDLRIGEELKQILKNFDHRNLKQVFSNYTDSDFKKEKTFQNIAAFQKLCKQQEMLMDY